jgi:putative transposase
MRWMHKIRLYPTGSQESRLRFMLDVTRQTYNALLQERRDAWRGRGISITTKQQYAEMTDLRKEDARFAAVYRECQDAVLHRLDLAMSAFFRRLRRGETPGYPRFKPSSRWKQLEFPHGNRALRLDDAQTRVRIPGVGTVKLRKGREVPDFGRAFVVEKNLRWYAVFECQREAKPLALTGKTIGVDRGVHVLAATSEGKLFANARHGERRSRILAGHAKALAAVTERDARGRCLNRAAPERVAAARRLARASERVANARLDWLHEVANGIVADADRIALEDLRLGTMTRSAKGTVEKPGRNVVAKRGLNRALLDAGFGILARLIREKAEYAAREVIAVDPRYSSQTCGRCLHVAAESRRRRRFCCVACGWAVHADVAAALEICRRVELRPTSMLTRARTPLTQHDAA